MSRCSTGGSAGIAVLDEQAVDDRVAARRMVAQGVMRYLAAEMAPHGP